MLDALEEAYGSYYNNLLESLKTERKDGLAKTAATLTAINSTLDSLRNMKEWPIDYSVLLKLATSGIASVILSNLIRIFLS